MVIRSLSQDAHILERIDPQSGGLKTSLFASMKKQNIRFIAMLGPQSTLLLLKVASILLYHTCGMQKARK